MLFSSHFCNIHQPIFSYFQTYLHSQILYRFSQSEALAFKGELFSASFRLNYVILLIQSKKSVDGFDHAVLVVPRSK